MKNSELISKKLDEALTYLNEQETKLKPFLDILQEKLIEGIPKSELSVEQAFNMYLAIQKQYTDSILLMTKIKEIMDFKD